MKFTLTINMDNAAFDSQEAIETGYILLQLGRKFFDNQTFAQGDNMNDNLYDHDGNKVGQWEVTE